jgi:hypothetical protein
MEQGNWSNETFKRAVVVDTLSSEFELEVHGPSRVGRRLDQITEVLREAYRQLLPRDIDFFDRTASEAQARYEQRETLRETALDCGGATGDYELKDISVRSLIPLLEQFGQRTAALDWVGVCEGSRLIRCLIVALFVAGKETELQRYYKDALAALNQCVKRSEEATIPDGLRRRYLQSIRFRIHYLTLLYDVIYGHDADKKLLKLVLLHTIDFLQRQSNQFRETIMTTRKARRAAEDLLKSCRGLLSQFGTPSTSSVESGANSHR